MENIKINGIYEHYKGNKYMLVGVANHSETLEKLVVYEALYGKKKMWARPEKMFCEKVLVNNKKIKRFKYVTAKY